MPKKKFIFITLKKYQNFFSKNLLSEKRVVSNFNLQNVFASRSAEVIIPLGQCAFLNFKRILQVPNFSENQNRIFNTVACEWFWHTVNFKLL